MFNFIKLQYQMGKITAAEVWAYAPGFITAEEADKIINGGMENEKPV